MPRKYRPGPAIVPTLAVARDRDPMDAASALASTVAHDLGNLLTVVLGNAELLLESLPDRHELTEYTTLILAAAQRGVELTERLDRLARRIPRAEVPADPTAAIAAWLVGFRAGLPESIRLEAVLPPFLGPAILPPGTITAALQELARNAVTAMGGKGRLVIAAALEPAGLDGGRLRLSVRDDGPGMSPETLDRVTSRRFTSGIAGHKTGIGIPLVGRIAEVGGGTLRIESKPASGTEATLYVAVKS